MERIVEGESVARGARPRTVALLVVAFLSAPGVLKAEAAGTGKKDDVLGFNVSAGVDQSFWNINGKSECQNCSGGIVDYRTEGVGVYRIVGELRVWSGTLLRLHHERPFVESQRQKEILRVNESQKLGSEKSSISAASDPIASRYFSDHRLSSRILRVISSIKFQRSRELFWGSAKANTTATFLPIQANIDYQTSAISGGIPVSAGDALSFRTEFSGLDVSMALFNFKLGERYFADCAFRLGYFQSSWRRLTDATLSQLWATPIIYEADYESKGFFLGYESTDYGATGLNFDLSLKWGVDNELNSAIDWKRLYGDDLMIQSTAIDLGVWYNFYLKKGTKEGLSVTPGVRFDLRQVVVETSPGFGASAFPAEKTTDFIFKYFVTAGYRF